MFLKESVVNCYPLAPIISTYVVFVRDVYLS